MRDITKQRFILDENVDLHLKQVFKESNIECTSVRDEKLSGIRNGELAIAIKESGRTLVTHDHDFEVLWRMHKLKVVLIKIHPVTRQNVVPRLRDFLRAYSRHLPPSFLIILSQDGIFYQER